jgi:hypothetical protein
MIILLNQLKLWNLRKLLISIATINNKAFEEFTGVKEERLIGMTDFEVFEADIAEAFVKKI